MTSTAMLSLLEELALWLQIASLRNDDGNDHEKINDLISWMRKNNRAARAARFLVQF